MTTSTYLEQTQKIIYLLMIYRGVWGVRCEVSDPSYDHHKKMIWTSHAVVSLDISQAGLSVVLVDVWDTDSLSFHPAQRKIEIDTHLNQQCNQRGKISPKNLSTWEKNLLRIGGRWMLRYLYDKWIKQNTKHLFFFDSRFGLLFYRSGPIYLWVTRG